MALLGYLFPISTMANGTGQFQDRASAYGMLPTSPGRSIGRTVALGALVLLAAGPATASDPQFSSFDVPTVFFINKSDDGSRVDYGMRLDQKCQPANDEAVFPYWREFDNPPVRTHGLKWVEYMAYGVSEQRIISRNDGGGVYKIKLKQFNRPIVITTSKHQDGRCSATARMTIASQEGAELLSVFLKLGGFLSVDYAEIHGKHPQTGAPLVERVKK